MNKTKNKTSEGPTNVVIKEEKKELQSLIHYIDDRVELVKQIFSALKPKTIKNLAPDSLKKNSIEEMEELCLNELLGISTKRLTSIINATKCPTDTESEDSDVHNIEEHISLEEISSDSEVEKGNKKTNKNQVTDKNKTKGGNATNSQQNEGNQKEISVLELIELQARARAIRSQLALEPIAKIEVDSDDDGGDDDDDDDDDTQSSIKSSANRSDISSAKKNQKIIKRSLSTTKVQTSKTASVSINGETKKSTISSEQLPKRIKLKRNFRRNLPDEDNNSEKDENRSELTVENDNRNMKSIVSIKENDIKAEIDHRNEKGKSPSPDVITILPSPETLCISDSSEDEADKESIKPSIEMNFMEKDKEKSITLEQSNDKEKENSDGKDDKIEESEVEDGEILEKEESDKFQSEEKKDKEEDKNDKLDSEGESKESTDRHSEQNEAIKTEVINDNSTEHDSKSVENYTEDRHNDDVISLEHEELDYDMKDNTEEYEKCEESKESTDAEKAPLSSPSPKKSNDEKDSSEHEAIDYIELHDDSSENENESVQQNDENSELEPLSWNSRWLKSAKVSKILAASRLGNRVRGKIKQSKKIEQAAAEAESKQMQQETEAELQFKSKYEDGSIQQYKEILENEKSNE